MVISVEGDNITVHMNMGFKSQIQTFKLGDEIEVEQNNEIMLVNVLGYKRKM